MTKQNPQKPSFPKALAFAVCFTIAYLLAVWLLDIPSGLDAIAYYLYFPPFVFVGGILLYYVFNFFKQIEKMSWFYSAIGLLVLISLYNSGFGEIDIKLKNMLHFSKLPKEYKTYRDINSDTIYSFGNKVMKLKFTSHNVIKTYINPNNELIVITEKIEGNSHSDIYQSLFTTYKLNANGDIIDQYNYLYNQKTDNDQEVLFEGYHVNTAQNYYHTWALDGDSTRRSISPINDLLDWDKPQQKEYYKTIAQELKFFTQYSSRSEDGKKLIFLKDGKCGIFKFNFYPDDGEIQSRGNTNNNLFQKYSADDYEFVPIKANNISYQYFHKEKKIRVRHRIGGNTPSTTSDEWIGELFTNLVVYNDTLRIKEELRLDPKWKTTDIEINGKRIGSISRNGIPIKPYSYFAHPKLNFQLFTNVENRLFIIYNKKNDH